MKIEVERNKYNDKINLGVGYTPEGKVVIRLPITRFQRNLVEAGEEWEISDQPVKIIEKPNVILHFHALKYPIVSVGKYKIFCGNVSVPADVKKEKFIGYKIQITRDIWAGVEIKVYAEWALIYEYKGFEIERLSEKEVRGGERKNIIRKYWAEIKKHIPSAPKFEYEHILGKPRLRAGRLDFWDEASYMFKFDEKEVAELLDTIEYTAQYFDNDEEIIAIKTKNAVILWGYEDGVVLFGEPTKQDYRLFNLIRKVRAIIVRKNEKIVDVKPDEDMALIKTLAPHIVDVLKGLPEEYIWARQIYQKLLEKHNSEGEKYAELYYSIDNTVSKFIEVAK